MATIIYRYWTTCWQGSGVIHITLWTWHLVILHQIGHTDYFKIWPKFLRAKLVWSSPGPHVHIWAVPVVLGPDAIKKDVPLVAQMQFARGVPGMNQDPHTWNNLQASCYADRYIYQTPNRPVVERHLKDHSILPNLAYIWLTNPLPCQQCQLDIRSVPHLSDDPTHLFLSVWGMAVIS